MTQPLDPGSPSAALDVTAARGPGASAVFAVVSGLVSAVPIGRSPRWVRRTVAGVAAGGTAVTALVAVRDLRPPEQSHRPQDLLVPVAAGAAVSGVAAGVMAASFAMDRRMESALVRRGVRRPRLFIGVAAATLSFVLDRVDQKVGGARREA